MNILILGASSKTSIGFTTGEVLRLHGHSVVYGSRSGKLGTRCDVTKPKEVRRLMAKTRPDVVILAAGVFGAPKKIGTLSDWKRTDDHVHAKSFGALVVANEFARVRKIGTLVVLGGREISSHPGFAHFTIGNGALWSLVRFLNTNTAIAAYYLDLPFVTDSAMHRHYIRVTRHQVAGEITESTIANVITHIIEKRPKKKRIVLGRGAV
jgi:NAD(P)-dependent dehydrogenase (short-subunit alcohol dehydrogenase family)